MLYHAKYHQDVILPKKYKSDQKCVFSKYKGAYKNTQKQEKYGNLLNSKDIQAKIVSSWDDVESVESLNEYILQFSFLLIIQHTSLLDKVLW